ncbi:MAG: CBS domain-containing protein [Acidimicrobiia bacterium]
MKKTVAHVISSKGSATWSVTPDSSVYEALELMADKNVGALVVILAGDLVGIMSERDYARKVVLVDRISRETPVSEIMTRDPVTVDPATTVAECMTLMTDNRFRHLPVVDNGQMVGVISIGDVVREVIEEQEFLIGQLESYITQ